MQRGTLNVGALLDFAAVAHPDVPIVSQATDEPTFQYDYAGLSRRVAALAHALLSLGIRSGDRVATLAWNTHRHVELMYAVPRIGAVLRTANPRLSDDQLVYMLDHGGAGYLLLDPTMLPLVQRIAPRLAHVRRFVMLGAAAQDGKDALGALDYETLIAYRSVSFDWPEVDEYAGALLCYTGGTTGDPKGVLYSHRSIVLHALAAGLTGAMNLSAFDVVMPCSSLYRASGWGLPYIAPINGCALVLPGSDFSPPGLHALIERDGVTFAGGVSTIWTGLLAHLDATAARTSLRRVMIGGSAVSRTMFNRFREHGVEVLQLWGMTETSPLGVAATATPALAAATGGDLEATLWARQGRRVFGLELRIVDDRGGPVPSDGETSGALQVRGPWVLQRYYGAQSDAVDADGWFDTGHVATIDGQGFVRLTDRAKDVIKSGGEWISSIDLENAAVACPGVRIAAAFGVPHPRWDERPVLVIERDDDAGVDAAEIRAFLSTRVAKWWIPDAILFESVPLTATGKIDKKALRARYDTLFMSGANE